MTSANLSGANLCGAKLCTADLNLANLYEANVSRADLRDANLINAHLVRCNLDGSAISGPSVYGLSAWDVSLVGTTQRDLVITPEDQPEITVDSLEVAQFVYLLLNNAKIREVIDTITSKAVLILGRFTPKRKKTLDALRDALRQRNYLPILFDFDKPRNRDYTETISTLAHLARFVIADLTDPLSVPQELMAIIPRVMSVPIRPVLLGTQKEWTMFSDLQRQQQVIPPLYYEGDDKLLTMLDLHIIAPAEAKARELAER